MHAGTPFQEVFHSQWCVEFWCGHVWDMESGAQTIWRQNQPSSMNLKLWLQFSVHARMLVLLSSLVYGSHQEWISTSSSSWLSQSSVPAHDRVLVSCYIVGIIITCLNCMCMYLSPLSGIRRHQEGLPLLVWFPNSVTLRANCWSGQTETRVSPTLSPPCWELLWRLPPTYTLTCSSSICDGRTGEIDYYDYTQFDWITRLVITGFIIMSVFFAYNDGVHDAVINKLIYIFPSGIYW